MHQSVLPINKEIQKQICENMILNGDQSPYDITEIIYKFDNTKNRESIKRAVSREFNSLSPFKKNDEKQKIAVRPREPIELHNGNPRYYYNLTNDGIEWFINEFNINANQLWSLCLNLLNNDYSFHHVIQKERNHSIDFKTSEIEKVNRVNHETKKSHLDREKWNVNKCILNFEKTELHLNRKFSPIVFNDHLKQIQQLQKENSFVLKGKILEIIELLGMKGNLSPEKIESECKLKDKDNVFRILHTLIDCGILKSESNKIHPLRYRIDYELSPLGIMLFIKQVQKDKKKIKQMINHYKETIPMIFGQEIWHELEQNTDVYDLLDSLTKFYFGGESLIFALNERSDLASIVAGQSSMSSIYYDKFKNMFTIGKMVLDRYLHKIESTPVELYGTKEHHIQDTRLANQFLRDAEETIIRINLGQIEQNQMSKETSSNLDFIKQLISIRNLHEPISRTQKNDARKPRFYDPTINETVANTISLHFYILLQAKTGRYVWNDLTVKCSDLTKWYDEYLETINGSVIEASDLIKSQIKTKTIIKHAEC